MKTLLHFFIAFSAALIFTGPQARADISSLSLGGGYSCIQSYLVANGRLVSLAKAKSSINKKLKKAKSENRKRRAASLKALLNQVRACASGSLAPSPFWSDLSGTYLGTYNLSAWEGPIAASFFISGDVVSVTLIIGGEMFTAVFGNTPINFQFNASGITFPYQHTVQGTILGDMTATFHEDGRVQILFTNPPVNDFTNTLHLQKTELSLQKSGQTLWGTMAFSPTGDFEPVSGTVMLTK